MPQMSGIYLSALTQSKQNACPAAEKIAAANSKDVDADVIAANCSLQQKQYDRALAHATHIIDALGSRPKPEGLSDADWASRKAMLLGRANWIAGIAYANESKLGPADKGAARRAAFGEGRAANERPCVVQSRFSELPTWQGGGRQIENARRAAVLRSVRGYYWPLPGSSLEKREGN